MKHYFLLAALALLLASCGPATVNGVDPYLAAEQARNEAEAAQDKAKFYETQLTATSQAQTVVITQTSAAFTMMQTQGAYKYTATAMAWTPTPVPTATPNAAATLIMANAIAQATQLENDTQLNNLKVERQRISNNFWAAALPIFLIVILLAVGYFAITFSRERRKQVLESAEGDTSKIIDRVSGEIIDMDANPNYTTGIQESLVRQIFVQWLEQKYGFQPQHPRITAERQDAVKVRDQMIDLKTRTKVSTAAVQKLLESQGVKFLPAPSSSEPTAHIAADLDAFPLPEWDKLMTYPFQAGGEFPFGAFAQELARIDVNKYPHLGLVGPTGCGKSRMFLRPFIASALAAGNRVIVLGDMVDFIVFKMHPNATLVPVYQITKPEDAAQYVNALAVINSEMERRFKQLAEQNLSTWERSGGENTLIVLDELGPNLDILDETNPQAARALRGFLSILISKGRKAGFNFVFASTRAVGLKKQLSQVSTIAFRLKDTDEERYAFGQSGFGAEKLPESYFLSKIGSTVRMTGSFNPSDQQLGEFLLQHTTKALDKPTWIEGVFKPVDQTQIAVKNEAEALPEPVTKPVDEIAQLAESIRDKWSPDLSATMIATKLLGFSQYGGSYRTKVDKIIEYLSTTTTTTTENGLKMPVLEGFSG